jgi:hypothetical protein
VLTVGHMIPALNSCHPAKECQVWLGDLLLDLNVLVWPVFVGRGVVISFIIVLVVGRLCQQQAGRWAVKLPRRDNHTQADSHAGSHCTGGWWRTLCAEQHQPKHMSGVKHHLLVDQPHQRVEAQVLVCSTIIQLPRILTPATAHVASDIKRDTNVLGPRHPPYPPAPPPPTAAAAHCSVEAALLWLAAPVEQLPRPMRVHPRQNNAPLRPPALPHCSISALLNEGSPHRGGHHRPQPPWHDASPAGRLPPSASWALHVGILYGD